MPAEFPAAGAGAADGPPLRVMSLHALAYCPRLFYLEEVEEIRVADHRVYGNPKVKLGDEGLSPGLPATQ